MATFRQNLITRRNAIAVELAALTATAAGGKPNMAGGGGAGIDHVGYKDGLYRELAEIDKQLANMAAADAAENGPWEIES